MTEDFNDEEDGIPLSGSAFIKKIDAETEGLIRQIIFSGVDSFEVYQKLRGKVLAYKHAKEIFLNKGK